MTTEDRLAQLLKAEADMSFSPASDGMGGIEARLRSRRRARTYRRIGAPLVLAAAAVTTALLLSGGSRPSGQHVNVVPAGPPTAGGPTTLSTIPAATEATTTSTVPVAGAAAALDAYLAAQPGVVAHSGPVADGNRLVAVAAVSPAADGRPIHVLVWNGSQWKLLTDLAFPGVSATSSFLFASGYPVSTADVTGDGRPDFLVILQGGDNNPGVIVSEDGAGAGWRLVPNTSTSPTSVYLGRSPVFAGNRVIAYFNDCNPNCAQGRTTPVSWIYNRTGGNFTKNPISWLACGTVAFTSSASSQGANNIEASAVDCATARSVAGASRGRRGGAYQAAGFDCSATASTPPYFPYVCISGNKIIITFDSNGG